MRHQTTGKGGETCWQGSNCCVAIHDACHGARVCGARVPSGAATAPAAGGQGRRLPVPARLLLLPCLLARACRGFYCCRACWRAWHGGWVRAR